MESLSIKENLNYEHCVRITTTENNFVKNHDCFTKKLSSF